LGRFLGHFEKIDNDFNATVWTLNQRAAGSNPASPTKEIRQFDDFVLWFTALEVAL